MSKFEDRWLPGMDPNEDIKQEEKEIKNTNKENNPKFKERVWFEDLSAFYYPAYKVSEKEFEKLIDVGLGAYDVIFKVVGPKSIILVLLQKHAREIDRIESKKVIKEAKKIAMQVLERINK